MSSTTLLHAADDASASAAVSSAAPSSSSSTTSSSVAAAAPLTTATLLDALKAHKEWARAVVFDADSRVLAATFKTADAEVDAWLRLFDKREDTIAAGIVLLSEQFDVHRFHPPLIYGRKGDPTSDDSEGICVCRVDRKNGKTPVFALITYTYPTLSARAAPQLKEFAETQLALLA